MNWNILLMLMMLVMKTCWLCCPTLCWCLLFNLPIYLYLYYTLTLNSYYLRNISFEWRWFVKINILFMKEHFNISKTNSKLWFNWSIKSLYFPSHSLLIGFFYVTFIMFAVPCRHRPLLCVTYAFLKHWITSVSKKQFREMWSSF